MAYYDALTNDQLIAAVNDQLNLENAKVAGLGAERVCAALNAAARVVVEAIARANRRALVITATRTVALGATSLALPDGTLSTEPRIRKLLEAKYTVAGTVPLDLTFVEGRELMDLCDPNLTGTWAVVHEGLVLRFLSPAGAPEAATITLRYVGALPAAAVTPGTTKPFAALPLEWSDVIVDGATARLLPTGSAAASRYADRAASTLHVLIVNLIGETAVARASDQRR
ncbi:MAG: hypothetical protein PHU85_00290 [Phycisphaerae bacterium]|nr:hypothetical protein [Phycisphaerae bacterium]